MLIITPLLINMKIASFFIALFVSVLTHARTAAAFEAPDFVFGAPAPSSNTCSEYDSAYTGKSGKGLRKSKSSKANSELGAGGDLIVNVVWTEDLIAEPPLRISIANVRGEHCLGELKALVIGALDYTRYEGFFKSKITGERLSNGMTLNQHELFSGTETEAEAVITLDFEVLNASINSPGDDSSGGSDQIQDEPVRS